MQLPLDALDIRILHVGRHDLGVGGWEHERLAGAHWRLYHNSAPGPTLIVAGEPMELEPGALYIIPPSSKMSSFNTKPFVQIFIHFDVVSTLPILFEELFAGPTVVAQLPGQAECVVELGRRVDETPYPNLGAECLAKAMVYEAYAQCVNGMSRDDVRRMWTRLDAVRPVMAALQHIERNLSNPIRNPELASLCRMSEDHFIRRFREAVGIPPSKYVLHRRIVMAAQRLLFTADTIDQIADSTGFTDRFYFSRIFAREMGRPPAAYRSGIRT